MTKVTRDQFEWDGDRLVHNPTGAMFNRRSQFINYKRAGETLDNGTCYEKEDVLAVANQLVTESKAAP